MKKCGMAPPTARKAFSVGRMVFTTSGSNWAGIAMVILLSMCWHRNHLKATSFTTSPGKVLFTSYFKWSTTISRAVALVLPRHCLVIFERPIRGNVACLVSVLKSYTRGLWMVLVRPGIKS